MSEVPRQTDCKVCGRAAKRTVTAPHLSATGSSAFQLVDRAARTAHEPDVVSRLPGQGRKPQRFTSNPLHAKLPRS
ncbi:zinc ribbon domain-containing protein [Leucobacter exalbidus]|nr:zinc ribbon domain-containing protein [Leucobacter exalbidus]